VAVDGRKVKVDKASSSAEILDKATANMSVVKEEIFDRYCLWCASKPSKMRSNSVSNARSAMAPSYTPAAASGS